MAPPHPLAGRSGEGPPIAPPNWKWRAGNRLSDMYFYSPSGKQFRSRPELANYLQTLKDPPDASLFCWRVTDEVLKKSSVLQVDSVPTKLTTKRKAQSPLGRGNKRLKTPASNVRGQVSISEVQPEEGKPVFPGAPGSNLPQKVPNVPSPPAQQHRFVNGREDKKRKRVRISNPHSFKSILSGRSSFKWLYDFETLDKFLEEAHRLKHKSAAEIIELRNLLVERNLDMANICKYPSSVIRIFVSLLRNEEPPLSMGKAELADLCVNWRCKKRNFWCLLELNRVTSAAIKNLKMEGDKREGLAQSGEPLSYGAATVLKVGTSSDHHASDGGGSSNQNGLLPPSDGPNDGQCHKMDILLANGAGREVEEASMSAEPSSVSQNEGVLKPGSSLSFESNRLDISTVGSALELNDKDDVSDRANSAEVGEGILQPGEGVWSRGPATNSENNQTSVCTKGAQDTIQTEQLTKVVEIPAILRHGGTAPVSWDSASLSEASEGLPQKGQPEVTQAGQPASDLDGENIIVITGFKSSVSDGTGSACQRVEAAHFNGGASATVLQGGQVPASTSDTGSRFVKAHNGRIISESVDGLLSTSEPSMSSEHVSSKKDGSVIPDFGSTIMPEATGSTGSTHLKDGSARLREGVSSVKDPGTVTVTREPTGISDIVHDIPQGEVGARSDILASTFTPESEHITVAAQGTLQAEVETRSEMLDSTVLHKPKDLSAAARDVSCQEVRTSLEIFGSTVNHDSDVGGVSTKVEILGTVVNETEGTPAAQGKPAAQGTLMVDDTRPETLVQSPQTLLQGMGSETVSQVTRVHQVNWSPSIKPMECTPCNLQFTEGNEEARKEHLKNGSDGNRMSILKPFAAGRESSACWCKICTNDLAFCRGCMCSICKKSLQPEEDSMVVTCSCNHVCHIDCAQAMHAAGVIKELGLDAELSCPSCSQKVDLLPFLKKRFDLISSVSTGNLDLQSLEKLVLQAGQLLKGTEKKKYQYVEGLLTDLHELLKNFSFLPLVQLILRTIRDELHTCPDSDTESIRGALSASGAPEVVDMLKKEELADECLVTARHERLLMEQVIDKVQRAYENAFEKRKQARSALASISLVRTSQEAELVMDTMSPPVTEEVLMLQRAKVESEMQKLCEMKRLDGRNMVTFGALDASAAAWLEGLKLQRVAVDSAQAELKHLENLRKSIQT